jgi:hypothetical protein
MPTDPDVLDFLRRGGILPVYWRRKRSTAKWHRGLRQGTLMTRSMCGRLAAADGARLLFAPIDGPWPGRPCQACEIATSGADAMAEAMRDPGAIRLRRPRRNP